MSSDDENEYYRQRAATERVLAEEASQTEVRLIHEELARQYDALLAQPALRSKLRIAF